MPFAVRADAPGFSHAQCLAQLDATVALSSNEPGQGNAIKKRFALLETHCDNLPQLAHNQGVLSARSDSWPEATRHFERALKLDARAAMTHRHLQQMHEYLAAITYARILDVPNKAKKPPFRLQSSSHSNAEQVPKTRSQLHDIATIEYELFAWWRSLQNAIGLESHYIDEHPSVAIEWSRNRFANRHWEDMQREIAFTAQDAVVIISDPFTEKTLLLMRLMGNRWKIYQETAL